MGVAQTTLFRVLLRSWMYIFDYRERIPLIKILALYPISVVIRHPGKGVDQNYFSFTLPVRVVYARTQAPMINYSAHAAN